MFFDEAIARFNVAANNYEEVINILAKELQAKKIVKNDFLKNVLERETSFPTGLDTGNICVAIPHTDSKYVNKSQIAFASLQKPVKFKSMVDKNHAIDVSIVFLIAMNQPHEQAEILTRLMTLFGKEELMQGLYECRSIDEYKDILKNEELV